MSNTSQKVTIIGAGRVATSLAHAFTKKGVAINQIYSRSISNAEKLSQEIPNASATDSLDFSSSDSTIFIVAISDDAIASVSKEIIFPQNALLAHTSGNVSLDVLKHPHSGIFYPLQTFTKESIVEFEEIPILIDGKTSEVKERLMLLGQLISQQTRMATEAERQTLHVAAVFASNFTNRMFAAANEILKESQFEFSTLQPLVEASIQNAFLHGPNQSLTGPARRGDQKTLDSHLQFLNSHPQLKQIYQTITDQILSDYSQDINSN